MPDRPAERTQQCQQSGRSGQESGSDRNLRGGQQRQRNDQRKSNTHRLGSMAPDTGQRGHPRAHQSHRRETARSYQRRGGKDQRDQ